MFVSELFLLQVDILRGMNKGHVFLVEFPEWFSVE